MTRDISYAFFVFVDFLSSFLIKLGMMCAVLGIVLIFFNAPPQGEISLTEYNISMFGIFVISCGLAILAAAFEDLFCPFSLRTTRDDIAFLIACDIL